MNYNKGKVKAYFGESHREDRDEIRRDLLSDRYSDILDEKNHLETLLDIPQDDDSSTIDSLFNITESLFDIMEDIIPEVLTPEVLTEAPPEQDKRERKSAILNREKIVLTLKKNAQKLVRAKSNVVTSRLTFKGAQSPEAKAKAAKTLRIAQDNLSKAGVRAGTPKEK